MRHRLKEFYERNSELLLPKEIVLRDRMEGNSRPDLLLYSSMKQFVGKVYRVSVAEVDQFDHLGTDYVAKERDVGLKRNVVVLKRVCWLYFR